MAAPLRVSFFSFGPIFFLSSLFLGVPFGVAVPGQQPPGNPALSVAGLKTRADSGDATAQEQLIQLLLRDDPGLPGYDLATAWLLGAAQTVPRAQFLLGYLYEQGHGLPRDYTKAAQAYQAAALQGNSTARNNLASLYQRGLGVPLDLSRAFDLYLASAQQDNPVAQYNLATLYHSGLGAARDPYQAARWFRAAALLGHPAAQHDLGVCYLNGLGLPLDLAQAVYWIRLSAQQGHAPALTDLGSLYEKGLGAPLDYVAAYAWYSRAIAAGDLAAKAHLKSHSTIMTRQQLDRAAANLQADATQPHDSPSHANLEPHPASGP